MAIEQALEQKSKADGMEMLRMLATKLIEQAMEGEQWAMLEIGNRLDGKPAQAIEHSGEMAYTFIRRVFHDGDYHPDQQLDAEGVPVPGDDKAAPARH